MQNVFKLERGFKVIKRKYNDGSHSERYSLLYFVNGRRKIETVGKNKEEAIQLLMKRRIEVKENKYFDIKRDAKIKFEDFAITFIDQYSKPNKKSWVSDEYNLKALKPYFTGRYLYEITKGDIENYISTRRKEVKLSSVNRELATLKKMWNFAIEKEILRGDQNVPHKIKQFKEPKGRSRFLNRDEILPLIANCADRLKPIVILAAFCGFRKGEILTLQWEDIDFLNDVITIKAAKAKDNEDRTVPMCEDVKRALSDILTSREAVKGSDFVFVNQKGSRMVDIRKSFLQALKKSGILDFHFHDLRHSFASNLVMGGTDVVTVKELLGHADMRMTMRYSHITDDHKKRAVTGLSDRIHATPLIPTAAQLPQPINLTEKITQVYENTNA